MTLTNLHRTQILLATLNDILAATSPCRTDTPSDGNRIPLLPLAYHQGSYRQLENALRQQRRQEPRLYWHVAEHHLRSHQKRGWQTIWLTTKGGRKTPNRIPIIVTVRHPAIQPELVAAGEQWLTTRLEQQGPIWLPPELQAQHAA